MSDTDPIFFGPASEKLSSRTHQNRPGGAVSTAAVSFDRRELNAILSVYGQKVAEGEWRDYAIDFDPACATFSVFRRSSEVPIYRIEKRPKLRRKQGAYAVIAATGLILKRGHDLKQVLKVFEKKTAQLHLVE